MASSLSNLPPLPNEPINLPDPDRLVRDYWATLEQIAATQGIDGLMDQLTRINGELQRNAQSAISSTISQGPMMDETRAAIDRPVLRLRPMASPSPDSERGRTGRQPSPPPTAPVPLLRSKHRGSGLGPVLAERIAMVQLRTEANRDREDR